MPNVDMDPRSFDKHAATRPIPVYIASTMDESDEISLVDLWRVIVRRKAIILASFLLSVLLAFVYLFFAVPVYNANTYLLPPPQQKIQGLLIDYLGVEEGIDVNRYTQESVYDAFLDNLKAQGMRREFFDNHELIKHYTAGKSANEINADRVFQELFNGRLKVRVDKQNTSFVTVSFSDSDPKLAAQWLNQIIDFVNKRTVHQLFSDVNAAIKSEIDQVRYQLSSKLKFSERRRRDRIIILKEAVRIAKALGIKDTGTIPRMVDKAQTGLAVNTAQVPLYMRGVDALETEIAVLESRKSDEPFIGGYRDLQERQSFLEGITIDPDVLSAVAVDTAARIPYRVEKPRKVLILSAAALLGIFGGVFAAFFREALSRAKKPGD